MACTSMRLMWLLKDSQSKRALIMIKTIKIIFLISLLQSGIWVQADENVVQVIGVEAFVMPTCALIDAYSKISTEYGKPDFNDESALDKVFAPEYRAFCNGEQIVTSLDHLKQRLKGFKNEHGSWDIEIISVVPGTEKNCYLPDKTCYRMRKFWTLPGKDPVLIELFIYSKDGVRIHKIIETFTVIPEEQRAEVRQRMLQD